MTFFEFNRKFPTEKSAIDYFIKIRPPTEHEHTTSEITDFPTVVSKTESGLCPTLPDETTTTKYLRQDGTWVAPPIDKAISITHADLATKISGSTLVPGQKYLITDFQTIYVQPVTNTVTTGDTEPLVVTALSSNTLEPTAFSQSNPYDVIYYDVTNNNTTKYAWATSTDKGQIYRRITKNGNDIPYDVRAIKFRRWELNLSQFNATTTGLGITLDTIQ